MAQVTAILTSPPQSVWCQMTTGLFYVVSQARLVAIAPMCCVKVFNKLLKPPRQLELPYNSIPHSKGAPSSLGLLTQKTINTSHLLDLQRLWPLHQGLSWQDPPIRNTTSPWQVTHLTTLQPQLKGQIPVHQLQTQPRKMPWQVKITLLIPPCQKLQQLSKVCILLLIPQQQQLMILINRMLL